MFKQITQEFFKHVTSAQVRNTRNYSKNFGAAKFIYEHSKELAKELRKSESDIKEEMQKRQVLQYLRPLKIMRNPFQMSHRQLQQHTQQHIKPQAHFQPQLKLKIQQPRQSILLTAKPQPKQKQKQKQMQMQQQQQQQQQWQMQRQPQRQAQQHSNQKEQYPHKQQQHQYQSQQPNSHQQQHQYQQEHQKMLQRQPSPILHTTVQALRQEMQLKQQQQNRLPLHRLPVLKPITISLQKMAMQKPLPPQQMMPLPLIRKVSEPMQKSQITIKPIVEKKDIAVQGFGREIIEVADAVGTAIRTIPIESRKIPFIRIMYEGLKSIENLLTQALERYGFQKILPLQQNFDPTYHEAIKTRHVKGIKPNIVIEVGRVGYKLHDRCIRPALVIISA